ncbi:MAG: hypothetical protein ACM3JD_17675 [Rudaea sp.]
MNQVLAEPKPLGVIDVITAGFELVRRRPWTLLIPILLDAIIWFLPRVTLGPILVPGVQGYFDAQLAAGNLTPEMTASLQQGREAALQLASSLNLFGLVLSVANLTAHLPSLMAPSILGMMLTGSGMVDVRSPLTTLAYTIQLNSEGLALLLFVPLFLLALFGSAIYAEWIAQGVRPLVKESSTAWLVRASMLWLRLIGLSLILAVIFFASSFLLGAVQFVAPAGTDIGSFIAALVLVGWLWVAIYFFFTVSGMAVSNLALFTAIQRSVLVFRIFFWPSLLLIGLTAFLGEGLALIWRALTVDPFGILLGIAANAFIGTSLFAASMVFYQDRMNAVERMIARARSMSRTGKNS